MFAVSRKRFCILVCGFLICLFINANLPFVCFKPVNQQSKITNQQVLFPDPRPLTPVSASEKISQQLALYNEKRKIPPFILGVIKRKLFS
jgi:hypothetical protein